MYDITTISHIFLHGIRFHSASTHVEVNERRSAERTGSQLHVNRFFLSIRFIRFVRCIFFVSLFAMVVIFKENVPRIGYSNLVCTAVQHDGSEKSQRY